MARDTIDRILDPDAVAVVGASEDETKRGAQVLRSLEADGYDGEIYAVNPNRDTVFGRRAFPSVSAIGEPVDLALVATPAGVVPSVLEGCAGADLAGAVVLAVGFGESDAAGARLEDEVVDLARRYNVRLVGPNTSGLINVHRGCNLVGADPPAGNLALLCQSGNVAIDLFTAADDRTGAGFSHYVGVGNEADLRFHEYLPHFARASETDAVLVYVEGMADGRAFLDAAHDLTPKVPIVALKGGRTTAGAASASSHTGAMAGDNRVAEGVYRQAGVVTVDRSDELLAVGRTLADQPPADGPNVAVLADGGGHATLAADALTERGLTLPSLAPDTEDALAAALPGAASTKNPVDVAGGTDDDQTVFAACADALLNDPTVDVLLLTGLFGGYGIRFDEAYAAVEQSVAARLADIAAETDTPVVVQSAYEGYESAAHETLREAGIPVLRSLEVATACVDALVTYGDIRPTGTGLRAPADPTDVDADSTNESAIVSNAVEAGVDRLSEHESRRVLQDYGVPLAPARFATTASEAATAVEAFDGPTAMKVVTRDVVHKSDLGGVALDVADGDAAREAFDAVQSAVTTARPDASVDGVLVSPMRDGGTELVVGAVDTEQFGPVAMVGPGGVFVEVLDDVAFRALPLDSTDARDMLADVDAQALLDGARGRSPVDREAVCDLLTAVSRLVTANPAITELDLNPVLATEEGVEALDASITLEQRTDARRPTGAVEVRGP